MNDANLGVIFALVGMAICSELNASAARCSAPRSGPLRRRSSFAFQSEVIGFGTDIFIAGLTDFLFAQLLAPKSCTKPTLNMFWPKNDEVATLACREGRSHPAIFGAQLPSALYGRSGMCLYAPKGDRNGYGHS
jgi:hypothetical protein